ncbi:MAG: phosphatidate cytidylyltransferase [Clostridia bacterium]|nr:phosphatidate cytidylyltransferase [Clostridia bacterium]
MQKRIFWGAIFGAIAILFLLFKNAGFIALMFVLGNICVYEINNAFKLGGIKSSPFFGHVFVVLLTPAYFFLGDTGIFLLLGICMYLNFCYFILRKNVDEEMLYSNLQFIYPCFMMSFVCPLLYAKGNLRFGFFIMLSIVLCCVATDIFAYFAGMAFGKHKLNPNISPKKTIEGACGGFLGSVGVSICTYFVITQFRLIDFPLAFMITIGIICGVFAQFGDLTASMIKRICGIKDFGYIIPGHGGVLDRVDSILFCLPVCYIALFVFERLGGV